MIKCYRYFFRCLQIITIAMALAFIVKLFLFQFYMVPTISMERTLMAGDGIIVNKLAYGSQLWKLHIPGYTTKHRNDVVVLSNPTQPSAFLVKRIIGLPGDTVQIVDSQVSINGKNLALSNTGLLEYYIRFQNPVQLNKAIETLKLRDYYLHDEKSLTISLMPDEIIALKRQNGIAEFHEEQFQRQQNLFQPHTPGSWNKSNYGPLVIPRKGLKKIITYENYLSYKGIILHTEYNTDLLRDFDTLEITRKPFIYTFKKNYYFLLGDNRNKSIDSRYFGFVDEAQIKGKVLAKVISTKNDLKINFSLVH